MKILLLSDTHSYIDDAILKHAKEADEIWHAGDFGNVEIAHRLMQCRPLRGVYGNIDGKEVRSEFPKDLHFNIDGLKIWMTHIGGYPGNFPPQILKKLKMETPQLFICGHSHILKVGFDKHLQILCFNPGAAGKYGFHLIRTMIRFKIEGGKIIQPEVIELGMRAH